MLVRWHRNQLRSNSLNYRLPRDLMEKMPSASNSPIIGRKVSSEDVNSKKGQPLSVASMVRRFERDTGLEHKNRGGESNQLERSNSSLNKESSKSIVKESRSSSRNSSLDSSQGNIPAAVSLTEIEAVAASSSAEAVVSEVKPVQTQKASTSKSTTSKSTTSKTSTLKTTTAKAATAAVATTSETSESSETSAKPSKTVRKFTNIYLECVFLVYTVLWQFSISSTH